MGRRHRRDTSARALGRPLSPERREQFDGVDYLVRSLTGLASTKPYRCPGCEQLVRPGTPHVVVWPEYDPDAADRRHWHTACWAAREHRRPGPRHYR
ncbi:MAG TPA: hypothetical protein VHC49_15190 [Mycobacteriales bacterium]|nr:hypothetical protein [Mycobacteriales bacterium]